MGLLGGERPPVFRMAWMLAAIYMLAVLAYAVSAGGEVASAVACTPVPVLACLPVVAAQVSSAGVDRLANLFANESDEWHATMDAWVDGYMRDYAEQHIVDRRVSNGGRCRDRTGRKENWELMARWVQAVERLQRRGDLTPFATAMSHEGIYRFVFRDGKRVRNEEHRQMTVRLQKWTQEPRRTTIMKMAAASCMLDAAPSI